jgi:hypothetical protein
MNPAELTILSWLFPTLATLACGAVVFGIAKGVRFLSSHPKTVPLADVLDICGQALEAAIKAEGAAGPTSWSIVRAEQAALAVLTAHRPQLEGDALAEIEVLVTSAVALKAGTPAVVNATGINPLAPASNVASNMPDVTAKPLGFVSVRTLIALATLALGAALARPAMAQIENPPVADHWEAGILTPGLKFNLTGSAPASIGAGSGVDFNYLFGRYLYTTKTLDATTGKPLVLPWFGISLFAQGSINLVLSGTVSETESTSVGVGFILLDSLTLGWFAELVDAGPGVQTSGLFTNHLSLSDTGPELFYSVSLGAL